MQINLSLILKGRRESYFDIYIPKYKYFVVDLSARRALPQDRR